MEVEEQFEEDLKQFSLALDCIDAHMAPFFAMPQRDLLPQLSAEEIAKLKLMMAFTLDSLFYMYMRTSGISPLDHAIMKELERVKSYMKKLKEATEGGGEEQKKLTLNKEAAARFLQRALKTCGEPMED